MSDEFADPASSTGINYEDLGPSLLLFKVGSLETGVQTTYGAKDAVRCDVTVIDGPKAGETYVDALVFPLVMIGQLRPNIGKNVLGRLSQRAPSKPGNRPAWALTEATDSDRAMARAVLAAAPATPPAADPWAIVQAADKPPF